MVSNTVPEQRPDRNGKIVTRHVKDGIVKNPDHRASGITIKPSAPFIAVNPEPFNELASKPTEQDRLDALKMTSHILDHNVKGRGWKDVMGNAEHSVETNRLYRTLQTEYVQAVAASPFNTTEHDLILTELSVQTYGYSRQSAHARAFEAGIETPYDRYFENLWLNQEECREVDYLADYDNAKTAYDNSDDPEYRESMRRGMEEIQEVIRTRGRTSYRNIVRAERLFMEAEANVQN